MTEKREEYPTGWVCGVTYIQVPTDKYKPVVKLIEFEPFNPNGYFQGTIMDVDD